MLLQIQGDGATCHLALLVDLLDEDIDGLAGLNRHVLIVFLQQIVKGVEQVWIVFGWYQLSLKKLKDPHFVGGLWSALFEGHEAKANDFLLECKELVVALGVVLVLVEIFLDLWECGLGDGALYII